MAEIDKLADSFKEQKSLKNIKRALVKGIPRQAVLKPEHALYRLQNQVFAIGDRVTMAQETGGVPLCVRGVVIGLNSNSIDVVWDVPFMSGTTLGNRYFHSACFESSFRLPDLGSLQLLTISRLNCVF